MTHPNHSSLLFWGIGGPNGDTRNLPYLKPYMKDKKVYVKCEPVATISEVELYCKSAGRNITGVFTTQLSLLKKLTGKEDVSIDNYAGSYFLRNGIEYVILDPLEHVHTVPYGKFLLERFTSKLVSPEVWLSPAEFRWRIADNSSKYGEAIQYLSTCDLIACDIETGKEPEVYIKCIGYTGLKWTADGYECFSFVIPINGGGTTALQAMRTINALPAAKIFQNGKYDIAYLSRYDAVPYNYVWDTAALMHCWYSELPKDLAFLQSFFVRTAAYWKDLADTQDLEQYYLYNAKDTWATLFAMLAWNKEAPEWARKNYTLEFPLQFPCHLSEMTGLKRDETRLLQARTDIDAMVTKRNATLDTILGVQGFNVYSPPQMKQLFTVLGCGDLKNRQGQFSADDKNMAKAAYRHPLNSYIIDLIRGVPKSDDLQLMGIRSLRKAKSTYLRTDEDVTNKRGDGGSKDFFGRFLYSLNPHGTDTGRLVSKSHHFWTGGNVQQVPVGRTVKQTFVADEGFLFGECDLEQAEARDVANISGDSALLTAVSGSRDFHSINASAFFGVTYESIYDDTKKKTLNKALRNLAKRVNHGANYNMGPDVLVDTMGEKAIYEAARLLNLNAKWTAREIATYLLARFDTTYPVIRGSYHKWIVTQIVTTKKLVGATGWTRYCFSDPRSSKTALNSYVAHPSQSLNAMVLNKAVMKVFYDIALHPDHGRNFKLCAQIHDSILFQFREGHEYLAELVRSRMEIPVTVVGADGKVRTFTVPAASKLGESGKGAKYWSETE